MDSRRSKLLAISLVVLSLVSIALYVMQSGERRPAIEHNDYAIAETAKVNRVQLQRAGDTVDLAFDNGRWKVNGQWDADVQMIKVLMATLQQIAPHRPVAAAQQDSVVARLRKTGTHVRVMEGDAVVRDFLVGGNPNKSEAWFLGEDNRAIVMIIPGYRVYVSGVFELSTSGWRNKRIFDFNWRNFRTLTATFAGKPYDGFTVGLKQRYFGIRELEEVDTSKLNNFLDAVSLLMVGRFIDSKEEALRLTYKPEEPYARIVVTDVANRTWSLDLYVMGPDRRERLGRISDGQWVTLNPKDAVELLRFRSYYPKPK